MSNEQLKVKITLIVPRDTPNAIADALIDREFERFIDYEIGHISSVERIRLIGMALVNYADACDRIDKSTEVGRQEEQK